MRHSIGWNGLADPEHRKILQQFATWHVLRHLRTTAERSPIRPYRNVNARTRLRKAAGFLVALVARGNELGQGTQSELDRWHAAASTSERNQRRPFLTWAAHAATPPPAGRAPCCGADQPGTAATSRQDPTH